MKAAELRIGNWVNMRAVNYSDLNYRRDEQIYSIARNGNSYSINSHYFATGNVFSNDVTELQPIPLTEEWLKRFGINGCTWEHPTGSNGLFWSEEQKSLHFYDQRDSEYSFVIDCEYVHQFQNAFALTGEELQCS